ncbi:MAG: F0F1 ATP synthase subunit C [Pseudomonadota bacterium]|jgi:F-type H+-transporting ATPase subunit c|nr:F0F1 ATP synthase subunit C [Pseudomonadota bacterium]MEC8977765.1 F0F1 ATP synthase subunit C [Pseudomonadota bacterium]|tara:strand:- start:607 stop:900 length:294 start_codon:yes stop_codon:yes gene_type:complete
MDMITHLANIQTTTIAAVSTIISIGAFSTAMGFTYLGSKFLECTTRQPEIASMLQTRMFMLAALLDGVTMIGIGVSLWFSTANPFMSALIEASKQIA